MPILFVRVMLLSSSELSKLIISRFFFVSGGLLSGDLSVHFPSRLRRSLYDTYLLSFSFGSICDSYTDNHFVREICNLSCQAIAS
jgi:hypothetical protein